MGESITLDSSNNLYVTGASALGWLGPSGEAPLHEHSGNADLFLLKLRNP
jgi:hypothetical protein